MKFIIFILIIIISLLTFILFKLLIPKIKKSIFFTVISTIIITHIIFNPNICLNSSLIGLKLFVNSVFVYLFPFLVLINIMISFNGVHIYSKFLGNILCKPLKLPKNCSIVLIVSILCGYPLGAKYACDLYNDNFIDFETCERLISIASNPSPLFIIGSVGNSMLHNNYIGFILLISCYLSCFIIGLIIPPEIHPRLNKYRDLNNNVSERNLGDVLKESIDNALKTSISIGGFIVFFSVISSIIKNNILFDIVLGNLSIYLDLPSNLLKNLILGFLEMTNGCNLISLNNINMVYKIIFISFFLGFSGLSIISQVYSIIFKYNFSIKKYINIKFVQGILCSILSLILYKINLPHITNSVFKVNITNAYSFTSNGICIISIIILIIPFVLAKLSKLFNSVS
ncbi:sporulation integral membrane protein YlbJ [Clostridium brassicae]|uniref:Sporulation integral membrane protein YlbJ n=1 Tax=Clostridium brassicae TaxID=2999072 RepID=A0ABT4DB14_9CLOT|nr:sporulation integral membrane protein YlbJ [Clostridium brassicae]MCY6959487.1 sporulation integral membrane protein YlbJ [Clostridium brassicae]